MKRRLISALIALFTVFSVSAQVFPDRVPELLARSAFMVEINTGRVLFSKEPDLIWPPASLTKLVTLHLVYTEIEAGRIRKDDLVPVSRNAHWSNLPAGSSLMFLEQGQKVTVMELMKGLAVSSGNDAAIALAEYISGSVPDFVNLMNSSMSALGFSNFHFEDASGLSENNTISAREFAEFCAFYIRTHKDALKDLHSLMSFVYPKKSNVPLGTEPYRWEIKQFNRNHLLGRMEGITGLKTGYIDESLFNVAISGQIDNFNVMAVILGTPGQLDKSGYMNRTLDSAVLISYAFNNFSTFKPKTPDFSKITVWYGREDDVALEIKTPAPP